MPTPPSDYWNRLVVALESRGLPTSQSGVARLLKMSQGSVQRWVRGGGMPTVATNLELAKLTGVSADWLYTGRPPMRPLDPKSNLSELTEIFQSLPPEGQQEILRFARYQKTIAFTGDPGKRAEFQAALVRRTTRNNT